MRSPDLSHTVHVRAAGATLEAEFTVPAAASGIVVFAHGSGSSRLSGRNRTVARFLEAGGLATLLLDLLTHDEEAADLVTREHRFDIPLLGRRVVGAADWTREQPALKSLPIAFFGASTGAAAALVAAAERPRLVRAVVSRGGRPDLARSALERVEAPTLLIVGSLDREVIELNRDAQRRMHVEAELAIVPGASHLFEEPGTLEEVARLARNWCLRHLRA